MGAFNPLLTGFAALVLTASGPTSTTNGAAAPDENKLKREVVSRGLKHPWSMAFIDRDTALVTEKDGGLWRLDLRTGRRQAIAGLPTDLDNVRREARDNAGLFDVVLDPEFQRNRRIFLSYAAKDRSASDAQTTTKLISARLEGFGSGWRLVDHQVWFIASPATADRFHYGGGLLINAGYLYLTVGERHYLERDNPPLPVAQDGSDRRGKIFRFALADRPTPPKMVAAGIRASQGLAKQQDGRRIWFTEHGPSGGDEINILTLGANYGWPNRTYGRFREPWTPPRSPSTDFEAPVFYWADRTVAPTGLAFLTTCAPEFADWCGDLLVAGLSRGYLMRLDVEGDRVLAVDYLLEDAPVRLRNVKEAPDGSVYVLTDEADGKVVRLRRSR